MSDLIIRPIDIERDAERLADMWNASDLQWPGSWTDGVPITAESVREDHQAGRMLVVFVAEVDNHIAGYCSYMDGHNGHSGEGYLALLNVDPRFQKRSIGRKLIQATIDRAVEKGWQRQTLGTWSSNFKAVPTYKKTGHFWTPDTSVWMQNFIPGALQLSLAQPFFDRHDWYSCYVRDLEQTHDMQSWEGLKVFGQHWEADGESLSIWIDREARAPVAVETDALQVAAIASDIEPLAGSKVDLRWRVVNKGDEPVRVYLHAMGDKGLEIDHRDAFKVPAGETVERTAKVLVKSDAPRSKEDGTAPAVKSILRLNDDEIELFSGMRVRQPLSVDTLPGSITVQPGRASSINLQLHSELDEPVTVGLAMVPPEGIVLDWTRQQVTIPAKGHISVPVAITAADEAVYSVPMRLDREGAKDADPVMHTMTVYSLGAGGMLVHRAGNNLRVETDAMRWNLDAKQAELKVEDVSARHQVLSITPSFGPPYWPSEFQNKVFDMQHETRNGRVIVRLSAEAKYTKGLWLHVTYALSPTGLATVDCALENRGIEAVTRRIHMALGSAERDREMIAVPLPQGTIYGKATAYPAAWNDAPRDAAEYAEPWLAWENQGAAAGFAWDDATTKIDVGWHMSLDTDQLTVAPGERSRGASYAVAATRGGWRDVRRQLLPWRGAEAKAEPIERSVDVVAIEPKLILTTGDTAAATLRVDSASFREMGGTVSLQGHGGVVVRPERVDVTALRRGRPLTQDVEIALPKDTLGLFTGAAQLSLDYAHASVPVNILRIGTGEPVQVREAESEGQTVWTIDNGASQFVVAPDFGPSMIAWNVNGENMLDSNYPTPAGRAWAYPWYGGLHAFLMPSGSHLWEGCLHQESLTAQPIEVTDAAGVTWYGLRVSASPQKRKLRGLDIELDYLTVGNSAVCKHVYRVRNNWGTERRVHVGINLTCRLGAGPTALEARGPGLVRRPANWAQEFCALPWAALTNPRSGLSLVLVGEQDDVMIQDQGQYGRILGSHEEPHLSGDSVSEHTYYLAIADTWEDAQVYLKLRG